MQAQGLLFLSRTPPQAQHAADGSFCLQLYAFDRINQHQRESWVVIWRGHPAQAFWQQHRPGLKPGAALRVEAQRMRAHVVGRAMPEIHAIANTVELVKAAEPGRCAETIAH